MFLSYKKLFVDAHDIEYAIVKSAGTECLCLQAPLSAENRLMKSFSGMQYFYALDREHVFKPLSICSDDDNKVVNALYAYTESGFLQDFLKVVPKIWQYATGKRLGRILRTLHEGSLTKSEEQKAQLRHNAFMERIAEYIAKLPHFKNDRYALDALSSRYDHFSLYKSCMRYGALRHQKIMTSKDGSLFLLPSASYGPGDICEDFALLELESAGLYPLLCVGVIDGYFKGQTPTQFWLHFALYSALYSLWKCAKNALMDKNNEYWQLQCDRVRYDFSDFTTPMPRWFIKEDVETIRKEARGL